MDYFENRFGDYSNKSLEELENIKDEVESDRQDWMNIFENEKSISEQKNDAWNEIKRLDDHLLYLDMIIKERKGHIR